MAYLTSEESRLLDELWITRRRQATRPSKSDILRAALILATQDEKSLDVVLSQQHVSTASRQRSSKAAQQQGSAAARQRSSKAAQQQGSASAPAFSIPGRKRVESKSDFT